MKKSHISLKNTLINALGTFISRITGIIKFNVVNYLFGAGADTFYSANANILALRKVLGEGPLVNSFLPVFSKEKTQDAIKADEFASNIINQISLISVLVIIIGSILTPYWTKIFLPGFANDPKYFNEIVLLTNIMLLSTVAFSFFSIAMGILNSHERFISSATSPILGNIIFIVFPIFTYNTLGIFSLAWGVVIGTFVQCVAEIIELYIIGFRYKFILKLNDPNTKRFWKLFVPTAINYLAQSGISIGLGFFASFLPRGSMTYLRNANTIMIAPVGFIGVAISGAIFPVFAKVKHDKKILAEVWSQGLILFLFSSIPFTIFFTLYPDIIVNIIFRDILRFFSGSTGKYSAELLHLTIQAVQILGSIIIPWSLNIMIGKLFYSLEKPKWPLILIIANFIFNIFGYSLARYFNWGSIGLVYADLVSAWLTLFGSLIVVHFYLPEIQEYNKIFIKQTFLFLVLASAVWLLFYPIYKNYYLTMNNPLLLLILGTLIFILGILIFGGLTYLFKINPLLEKKRNP